MPETNYRGLLLQTPAQLLERLQLSTVFPMKYSAHTVAYRVINLSIRLAVNSEVWTDTYC